MQEFEVSDEHIKVAQERGIKLNKRKKEWQVIFHEEMRVFQYGIKSGVMVKTALDFALKEVDVVESRRAKVAKWNGKQCDDYVNTHAMNKYRHRKLDYRRDMIAAHMWKNRCQPVEPTSSPGVAAVGGSDKPQAAGNQWSTEKECKLFGMSTGKTEHGSPQIVDVTSTIFRDHADVAGPDVSLVAKDDMDTVWDNTLTVIPRIALVKYLEAVNMSPGDDVFAHVVGAKLDKGKNKGRMLIRSVFVHDTSSSIEVNEAEHAEWLLANKATQLVGRWDFF